MITTFYVVLKDASNFEFPYALEHTRELMSLADNSYYYYTSDPEGFIGICESSDNVVFYEELIARTNRLLKSFEISA